MNNITTIFFDLDDTLIIEREAAQTSFREACTLALNRINNDTSISELINSVKIHARNEWHKLSGYPYCLKIGISSWEGLWSEFSGSSQEMKILRRERDEYQLNTWISLLEDYGVNDLSLANKMLDCYRETRKSINLLNEGANQILHKLSTSYKLGIISNGARDMQMGKIYRCGIKDSFDHIIISEDVGIAKPNNKIFNAALNKFKCYAQNAIMIGDSLSNDICGANAIGMQTIHFKKNNSEISEQNTIPDYTINKLLDIQNIL